MITTATPRQTELNELPCPDLSVGEQGDLLFAGRRILTLAECYGTPLYLMSEDRIRQNCRRIKAAVKNAFSPKIETRILYASKAAAFKQMYRIIKGEKMGADVVSSGEIYTALAAGFPPEDIFFHSNNKTDADIKNALDCGIGHIVVDGEDEMRAISNMAIKSGKIQPILLRITPGIDPHTFEAVSTGRIDSKFGCAIETGQAEAATALALSLPGIKLDGLHCHVGSQIFDTDVYLRAVHIMLRFMSQIRHKFGYTARYLDLGGGFGVPYLPGEKYPDLETLMRMLASTVISECDGYGMPYPCICFEPGRSVVADAGITVYTVGSIKHIPGYKNYVSVDGGMTDNPRFALYRSSYTLLCAERPMPKHTDTFSVVGRCCESGDVLQHDVSLPHDIGRGEHIVCLTSGAYNYSMASNYNRIPRPPVIMLKDGKEYIAVKRESFADIAANDI